MFLTKNKTEWTVKEKTIWGKLYWRLKFLLTELRGKNRDAIICSLHSAITRGEKLAELLHKRNVIIWNKGARFLKYKGRKFFYKGIPPVVDLIDIWMIDEEYIARNFINNSAYKFSGSYEGGGVFLKRGDYVIDAGANFGLFSVLAGEKIGESGKAYAFEPIIESRKLLLKNLNVNKVNNVKIISNALGENNNKIEFVIFNNLEGSSGYFQGDFPKEKVDQIKLDDFVKKNGIKKVDFIKADIEGMERDLLFGAEEIIKKFHPKISICTYHRPDDPDILQKIIQNFIPEYKILKTNSKLYAWI
jgi:FkbM family methyltransferase